MARLRSPADTAAASEPYTDEEVTQCQGRDGGEESARGAEGAAGGEGAEGAEGGGSVGKEGASNGREGKDESHGRASPDQTVAHHVLRCAPVPRSGRNGEFTVHKFRVHTHTRPLSDALACTGIRLSGLIVPSNA